MNKNQSKLQKQNDEGQIAVFQKQEFSGPVPHPEIVEKYEKILPGAAKNIFENWNKQVEHRQHLEKEVINSDIKKSKIGLFLGFIIVMTAIVGGIITALQGQLLFGGGITFTGLAFIVIAFVTNKFPKK